MGRLKIQKAGFLRREWVFNCVSMSWFQCWETQVGQEMYKLMIFDFIIILAVTLFVDFPRK